MSPQNERKSSVTVQPEVVAAPLHDIEAAQAKLVQYRAGQRRGCLLLLASVALPLVLEFRYLLVRRFIPLHWLPFGLDVDLLAGSVAVLFGVVCIARLPLPLGSRIVLAFLLTLALVVVLPLFGLAVLAVVFNEWL